jgi:hypothetical protein
MATDPIFVEPDEELPGVIERIKRAPAEDAPVVLPPGSRFAQSRFNFQLLQGYAVRLGKRVTIICPDAGIQRMARENGFGAVATIEQFAAGYAAQPAAGALPPEPHHYQPAVEPPAAGPCHEPAREAPLHEPYDGPGAPSPPAQEQYYGPEAPSPPAPEPYYQPPVLASPAAPLGWNVQADPGSPPPVDQGAGPWVPPPPSSPPPGAWSPYPPRGQSPTPRSGLDPGTRPRFAPEPGRGGDIPPPRAAARGFSRRMRLSIPTYLAPPDARPGRFILYGGAALVLLVGMVASIVYMPSAEVDMVAQAQPFSSNVSVSGDPGRQPIPIRVVTASKSASQTFTASTKVTTAQAAKGTIAMDASGCGPPGFVIPNGTRLRGPGGVGFATSGGDVQVPVGGGGSSQPVQASIIATSPGAAGNVAAGPYVFENPGQAGCIQISGAQTTGGTDQQQKQLIQQSDITNAQNSLEPSLKQQLTDQLSKGTQGGEKLATEATQWKPVLTTPGHQVGDAVQTFSASLVENATAYYYRPADVSHAIADSLKPSIPAGKQFAGDLNTDYQVTATGNGHLTFAGKVSGFVAPQLNSDAIKAQVAGRSPSQVQQALRHQYPVQDVQVKQYPFGLPFMPLSASRVTVRYQILSGAGSG